MSIGLKCSPSFHLILDTSSLSLSSQFCDTVKALVYSLPLSIIPFLGGWRAKYVATDFYSPLCGFLFFRILSSPLLTASEGLPCIQIHFFFKKIIISFLIVIQSLSPAMCLLVLCFQQNCQKSVGTGRTRIKFNKFFVDILYQLQKFTYTPRSLAYCWVLYLSWKWKS